MSCAQVAGSEYPAKRRLVPHPLLLAKAAHSVKVVVLLCGLLCVVVCGFSVYVCVCLCVCGCVWFVCVCVCVCVCDV